MGENGQKRVKETEMTGRRYKRLETGSFSGELLYGRAVPNSEFLRHLGRVVQWEVFSEREVNPKSWTLFGPR